MMKKRKINFLIAFGIIQIFISFLMLLTLFSFINSIEGVFINAEDTVKTIHEQLTDTDMNLKSTANTLRSTIVLSPLASYFDNFSKSVESITAKITTMKTSIINLKSNLSYFYLSVIFLSALMGLNGLCFILIGYYLK